MENKRLRFMNDWKSLLRRHRHEGVCGFSFLMFTYVNYGTMADDVLFNNLTVMILGVGVQIKM